MNTLALGLAPVSSDEVIDRHGGRQDLGAGLLRILYSRSFEDDPTRILRGLELEQRLGLRFEAETEERARCALAEGLLEEISGDRLRRELFAALDGPDALDFLERAADLGLLAALHPRLRLGPPQRRRVAAALGVAPPRFAPSRPLIALTALAWHMSEQERRELAERLSLGNPERESLIVGPGRVRRVHAALAGGGLPAHRIGEHLAGLSQEGLILAIALRDAETGARVRRVVEDTGSLSLAVRGRDLVDRGFAPGPRIGAALLATRRARLDGAIDEEEELEFALDQLAQEKGTDR